MGGTELTTLTQEDVSGLVDPPVVETSDALTCGRDRSEAKVQHNAVGRRRSGPAYSQALTWIDKQPFPVPAHVHDLAARALASMWEGAPTDIERPDGGVFPQVFPLPGSGVQIEWHAGEDHIELSVEYDGTLALYFSSLGASEDYELAPAQDAIPNEALACLGRISDAVWAAHQA